MSLTIDIRKKTYTYPIFTSNSAWLQDVLCRYDPDGSYWEARFDFTPEKLERIEREIRTINLEATRLIGVLRQIKEEGCEQYTYTGGTA